MDRASITCGQWRNLQRSLARKSERDEAAMKTDAYEDMILECTFKSQGRNV
jgi:hypothetical protein